MSEENFSMQIEKTFREFDAKKLASIYESLDQTKKQISFSSRGNITDMQDGVGSIFDYQPAVEWDWDHINPIFKGTYLETVYNTLAKDYKLGRARFMRMDKNNRALSYHYDEGIRLHIPIMTNPHAWFVLANQTLYNMSDLGTLYILDANEHHSALNLCRQNLPRVHIVISAL
jgi:hypothetical protein